MASQNWFQRVLGKDVTTGQRYPFFTEEEVPSVMDTWQGHGYQTEELSHRRDGLWVTLPYEGGSLQVQRNRITIHNDKSDVGILAALKHAQQEWPNGIDLHGSDEFKLRAWAHAQVAGVKVGNYTPPPHLMAEARNLVGGFGVDEANRRIFGIGFEEGTIGGPSPRPMTWAYSMGPLPFAVDARGFPTRLPTAGPSAPQPEPAGRR